MVQIGWLLLLGAMLPAVSATGSPQLPSAESILALARDGRAAEAIEAYRRLPDGAVKSALGVDLGYVTERPDLALEAYRAQRRRLGADDPTMLRRFATNVATPLTAVDEPSDWVPACAAVAALGADERASVCRTRLEQTASDPARDWMTRGLAVFAAVDLGLPPPAAARVAFENEAPVHQRLTMAIRFRSLAPDERAALAAPVAAGSDLHDAVSAGIVLGESCSSQALAVLRTLATGTRSELKNIGLLGLAACGDAGSLDRLRPLAPRLTPFDQVRIAAGDVRLGRPEAIARFESLASGTPSEQRKFAWLVLSLSRPLRAVDLARQMFASAGPVAPALLLDTMPIAGTLGPQPAVIDALASSDLATRANAATWLARALSR